MNRFFLALCTSGVASASLFLAGCPALQGVQVSCESSLDCPTNSGCGPNKICSQGLAESVLTVEPGKVSVAAAASTAFTAKLDGQSTTSVTWGVEGDGAGTIDSSGLYTAPSEITVAKKVQIWAALKRHPDFKTSSSVTVLPPDKTVAWVMGYFENGSLPKDVTQDPLHLAYSADGAQWTPLAPRAPAYRLTEMGSNHLRDPFILRKEDGAFVLLASDWTRSYTSGDYWSSPSPNIVVADSADLITFTNPRLLQVTPIQAPNGVPMHAWAPEAFFDADLGHYAIIWAGNDANDVSRIYVSYTSDFQTLVNPDPVVFFDPGYSVIDATLARDDAHNYLLFKDESDSNGGPSTGSGKDIQIARSASRALTPGTFNRWSPEYVTRGSDQSTRTGVEGAFVIKPTQVTTWTMCADLYTLGGGSFGCWSTTDLGAKPSSWTRLSSNAFSMPPNAQHASTVRVTQAELDALVAHYGTLGTVKIKSTSVDSGGRPLYLVHSWFHGIITYDTNTANGQLATDFGFRMSPSLAIPNDPDFVSFAAPGFPGSWLRVNSANPTAWVTGDALTRSNQSQYLSQIPEDQKNHLLWLDPHESSTTYAMDATFKVVPALNQDPSMVSFMWCGESKNGACSDIANPRYLCHSYLQVFALHPTAPCGIDPNDPKSLSQGDVKDAMSFTLITQK